MLSSAFIELRGVSTHNLQEVDLDLPLRKLIAICGVSGSGKTSLALDTLHAEGQRRYIESFSAYTRQFLTRLEKPPAERIDNIPPAVAVRRRELTRGGRATIGGVTEIDDFLRLLFAKIGRVFCPQCGSAVSPASPDEIARVITAWPAGLKYMIAFPRPVAADESLQEVIDELREDGFVRAVASGDIVSLNDASVQKPGFLKKPGFSDAALQLQIIVDRLTSGGADENRIRDSLETAYAKSEGRCTLLVNTTPETLPEEQSGRAIVCQIGGQHWARLSFSESLRCETCQIDFPTQEPRLFSARSPLGACPTCEGFGDVVGVDMNLVAPHPRKTLRQGAIAPWNTPAYVHEKEELLALADDYGIPTDLPFCELDARSLQLIQEGVAERDFGGLDGFFRWLEKRKYKVHIRVFLSRWRSYRRCPACGGARLHRLALATRVGNKNFSEITALPVREAREFFHTLELSAAEEAISKQLLGQVTTRLHYLREVGLDYLEINRALRTLCSGEIQRVRLTSALGSSLVNMLYVLDEPTVSLHPHDVRAIIECVRKLRDRGNTVIVVEHQEGMLRAADEVVEMGPEAGERGGRIVFQGQPKALQAPGASLTGEYLTWRRGASLTAKRRPTTRGWIQLQGARGNNLKNLTVRFPLGVLCLVTGVSGAGKSSLVNGTLYPALLRRKKQEAPAALPYDDVFGDGQIDEIVAIDQSAIARSPRSNPVTYIKAFDDIRNVFATTLEARTHNYTAGHFSFNVDGGRCTACKGDGLTKIDMQFLPDVYMKCAQCGGARFQRKILEVRYRNRSIADVLEMTIREAFAFFRGQAKVQAKLGRLIDVGLEYLRLGQPANTLSDGEAKRLKLASHLSSSKRKRTLFLLDEPTAGLHFSDVIKLLDCFDALLNVGHSLIIVEHNSQLMRAADYIIDLGPDAGPAGGGIVAEGTPEELAQNPLSKTGLHLAETFAAIKHAPLERTR